MKDSDDNGHEEQGRARMIFVCDDCREMGTEETCSAELPLKCFVCGFCGFTACEDDAISLMCKRGKPVTEGVYDLCVCGSADCLDTAARRGYRDPDAID